MQLKLTVLEGSLVLGTICSECHEAIHDSLPLEVALERLREGAGKVGNALVSSMVNNLELALPDGLELFDTDWPDVVSLCRGCAVELAALRDEAGL